MNSRYNWALSTLGVFIPTGGRKQDADRWITMSHVYLFGGGGFQLQSEDLQSCQRGVEGGGGGRGGGEVPEGGGKSSHAMQRRRGQLQNTCRVLFGKQMKMQVEVPPSSRVVLRILRNTRAGSRIVLRILRVTRAQCRNCRNRQKTLLLLPPGINREIPPFRLWGDRGDSVDNIYVLASMHTNRSYSSMHTNGSYSSMHTCL